MTRSLLIALYLVAAALAGGCIGGTDPEPVPPDSLMTVPGDSLGVATLPGDADSTRNAPTASADTMRAQRPAASDEGQDSPVESLLRETYVVQNFGFKLFWAAVVLSIVWLLIRGVAFILDSLSERSAERRLFYKRLVPIVRIFLWTLAAYVVIRGVFDVDATSLLAAAAAIGVAVGFAAQDLLKNIFGGLVIISDRPFQVGDKILVGGTYGEVTNIGLRSTRLVTPDDSLVSVPNAQVVDGQVSNTNAGALDCQVVTELYLPGLTDELTAKRIAYEAAASSKYVYRNKPIVVLVEDEFKETFLTRIKVKAYVFDTRHEFRLKSDITERARRGFRDAGLINEQDVARAWMRMGGTGAARKTAAPTTGAHGGGAADE